MDVNAIDLTGIAGDAALATDLEVAAADNLKRVRRAPAAEPDWTPRARARADDRVPGDQDRLAPDRRLTGLRVSARSWKVQNDRCTRVIVLAGPSGSGKSRLAERLGLPVLRLDDFYKDGDDPTLPADHRRRQRRDHRLGPPGLVACSPTR